MLKAPGGEGGTQADSCVDCMMIEIHDHDRFPRFVGFFCMLYNVPLVNKVHIYTAI